MSPNLRRITSPFWRVALIPCVLQLFLLSANAFAQDGGRGTKLFRKIDPAKVKPVAQSLKPTTEIQGLSFGFIQVITNAAGQGGPLYDRLIQDPAYATILVQMHNVFADLNQKALTHASNTMLTNEQRIALLNDLTSHWESVLDQVISNSTERADRWQPLITLVQGHFDSKPASPGQNGMSIPLNSNDFQHRARVYYELATAIRTIVEQYDERKRKENDLIDSGVLPQGDSTFAPGYGSDYPSSGRCRKRKRCALELLF